MIYGRHEACYKLVITIIATILYGVMYLLPVVKSPFVVLDICNEIR